MGENQYDVAVVGGGASGLAAAIGAGWAGGRAIVLEKLPRVGKKLLATGNGRCNLGNLHREDACYQGSVGPGAVLDGFGDERAFFASLGLVARPDGEGRLYPASHQAASVLDALRLECARLGVTECCGFAARRIAPAGTGFRITAEDGATVAARRVVLAAGGRAAPKLGTGGDGHRLARELGHTVTPLSPALGPVPVAPKAVGALKGLRVSARVTGYRGQKAVKCQQGQVQFGDGALSGICVFNLAACRPDAVALDLLPWCDDPVGLLGEITSVRAHAGLEDFLTGLVPKRVGQVLLKACVDMPLTAPVSRLDAGDLERLGRLMKDWRFASAPPRDWDAAQVTAGGVTGVGPSLESPLVPGLFFAGELLDVHGDCGGYNLLWAWASGVTAGQNAARSLLHD